MLRKAKSVDLLAYLGSFSGVTQGSIDWELQESPFSHRVSVAATFAISKSKQNRKQERLVNKAKPAAKALDSPTSPHTHTKLKLLRKSPLLPPPPVGTYETPIHWIKPSFRSSKIPLRSALPSPPLSPKASPQLPVAKNIPKPLVSNKTVAARHHRGKLRNSLKKGFGSLELMGTPRELMNSLLCADQRAVRDETMARFKRVAKAVVPVRPF